MHMDAKILCTKLLPMSDETVVPRLGTAGFINRLKDSTTHLGLNVKTSLGPICRKT